MEIYIIYSNFDPSFRKYGLFSCHVFGYFKQPQEQDGDRRARVSSRRGGGSPPADCPTLSEHIKAPIAMLPIPEIYGVL
jgi:hypothetical protein